MHWLSRWQSEPRVSDALLRRYSPWESTLRRAEQILREHVEPILEQLKPWAKIEGPLQVCVRDLRAEHVLYTDTEEALTISGIVDFGAAQIDHPAVDLARLLGDYTSCTNPARSAEIFTVGLQAYESTGYRLGVWEHCVPLLSQSGALAAVIRWLDRLEQNRVLSVTPELVFHRVRELLRCWL
jgi:Ser/Thr protein kinase RdoA (MazF antagonist)